MTIPKRRWPRFTVRTLFVITALVATGMWFVLSNLMQLRQRDRVMHATAVRFNWGHRNRFETDLPMMWSLFGAKCYDCIAFPSTTFTEEQVAQLQVLFPEAQLSLYDPRDVESVDRMPNR